MVDDGNISKVVDVNGNNLYSGTSGMQGTLQEWLDLKNAYETLMKPAGFKWDGENWSSSSGTISNSILKQKLTEQQYELIKSAVCLVDKANEKKEEKELNLFQEVMQTYVQSEVIKTQMQIAFINRVLQFFLGDKNSDENQDSNKNQQTVNSDLALKLSNRFDKVKKVKYSNNVSDISYTDEYIPTEDSEYFNCINFVCYMFNITASYSVANFEKYSQFKKLTGISNVNKLQVGDVITWEYESGVFDSKKNPIYEYHASIWKGNGEIWECMDPKGVRIRNYKQYYDYMNTHNMKIKAVKYFRYKGKDNEK